LTIRAPLRRALSVWFSQRRPVVIPFCLLQDFWKIAIPDRFSRTRPYGVSNPQSDFFPDFSTVREPSPLPFLTPEQQDVHQISVAAPKHHPSPGRCAFFNRWQPPPWTAGSFLRSCRHVCLVFDLRPLWHPAAAARCVIRCCISCRTLTLLPALDFLETFPLNISLRPSASNACIPRFRLRLSVLATRACVAGSKRTWCCLGRSCRCLSPMAYELAVCVRTPVARAPRGRYTYSIICALVLDRASFWQRPPGGSLRSFLQFPSSKLCCFFFVSIELPWAISRQ